MSETHTPGQVAYEAAWRVHQELYPKAHRTPWTQLHPAHTRAWEAAAQAVLAQSQTVQGIALHTLLEFLITSATPEALDALHLWLSEATASLHAERQDDPDEETP